MKTKNLDALYEISRASKEGKLEVFFTSGAAPHFHPDLEMLIVTSGEIRVTVNNKSRLLKRGDIAFAGAFDIHYYDLLTKDAEGIVLIPDIKYIAPYTAITKTRILKDCFLSNAEIFSRVEPLALSLKTSLSEDCELYNNSMAMSIIALVTDNIGFEKKPARENIVIMRDILAYVHNHFDENLTVASLAHEFGYTPNHFSHIFNSYTNHGFKEYLNSVRACHAAALIDSGEKVLNTAMKTGFESLRTFYRAFSARYGTTPKKYAKLKTGAR